MSRWDSGNPRRNHISQLQYEIDSTRCRMIDLDGVFRCDQCKEPYLCVEEEVSCVRDIRDKFVNMTVKVTDYIRLAQKTLGIPTRCVGYAIQVRLNDRRVGVDEMGDDVYTNNYHLLRISPPGTKVVVMDKCGLVNFFMAHRDKHEKVCIKPTGMQWDGSKQKDVKVSIE